MKHFLLPGLQAKRNAVRLGSLLLKCAVFFPLPLLCQSRAVSSTKIPFSFLVDGKTLPAGEYELYRDTTNIYSLRSRSGVLACRLTAYGDAAAHVQDASKFVFRSSANGYQLESFWTYGSSEGMRVLSHRRKREEVAARSANDTMLVASTSQTPPKR